MTRHYTEVDVFTDTLTLGNPVAVVHDADGLSDERMAAFARWTNLSETTFLMRPTRPGADYRLRIFTPGGELPFAGHPTLGSARAWVEAGGVPATPGTAVMECGVGLVDVRLGGAALAFAAGAVAALDGCGGRGVRHPAGHCAGTARDGPHHQGARPRVGGRRHGGGGHRNGRSLTFPLGGGPRCYSRSLRRGRKDPRGATPRDVRRLRAPSGDGFEGRD